ncbi:MAG: hypothetical protein IPH69_06250 [Bacteroidales bacterium]|nr:hypothetical protein [Bacteroidales bacterium]
MNAITFYYLGQYLVVFVISYFRIRKAFRLQDPSTPDIQKFNWKPVFFVNLELVYTSAGLIILLISDSQEWTPAIIIFYVILILISSNMSSIEDRFSENSKLNIHLIITLIIIVGSIIVLNKKTDKNYQISIPFSDYSLEDKKRTVIKRNYYIEIISNSEKTALDSALSILE